MRVGEGNTELTSAAERPIYAIFEGGGAKGVAHVGALQAVEDNGLEVIGVAGTSAGALIAVLAAIGLKSEQIMNSIDPADNLLERSDTTVVELLGSCDWKRFLRMRSAVRKRAKIISCCGIFGAIFAPRALYSAWTAYRHFGHFSTAEIKNFINKVIRERLQSVNDEEGLGWEVPEVIDFRELARGWPGVVPLKIIVTDVDRGTLEILDSKLTPDVVVAEAVAASISIPLIFRPAAIPSFREGRFADGGLVSNLPIWAFSEEKLRYERKNYLRPPVPTVGFSLQNSSEGRAPQEEAKFSSYLLGLVSAALQGSQSTASRFLDDVMIVPLSTHLDLLNFDANRNSFCLAREQGRRSAEHYLRFALEIKPDKIRAELESLRGAILEMVNRIRGKNRKVISSDFRVSLIRPYGSYSLRVMESLNMDEDADDRMLLDRQGQGSSEAFRERGVRVFRLDPAARERARGFMTKYEHAMVRSTLRAVVCVPIFADLGAWDLEERDRPEPSGVLAIDSDENLASEFRDDKLLNMLVAQSVVLYEAVNAERDHDQDEEISEA